MIKLSITLPSGGGIALEADDREFVREVLYSAMPHLLPASPAGNGDGNDGGNSNGNGQYHNGIVPGATLTETPPPHANGDAAPRQRRQQRRPRLRLCPRRRKRWQG